MKSINQNKHEKLNKLNSNDPAKISRETNAPLDEGLAESLVDLIDKGHLDISVEELKSMSNDEGERCYWMGNKPDYRGARSCTQRQCKRIRVMMREKLIEYIPENELKILSFQDAETIIRNGDEHVMKRKISRRK